MISAVGQKLIAVLATLLVASMVVFTVMEVLPGDPATVILGINARADTLAALRAELGLDRPVVERYGLWLWGMLQGDFGQSYTYSVPVAELIAERVVVSLPLALMALVLATVIGVAAGVGAAALAVRPGAAGLGDPLMVGLAQIGIAIPNFWFAMLLIMLFAVWLGWVPAGGFAGWDAGVGPALLSLLLPAISLALPQAAILTRITRSAVIEALSEDYIRTARARGLTRSQTLWRHALPNALIPIVTIMGLQFSFLVAGTIIIENVFYLPGIGRLIFQAIAQRDLIVVESLVMLLVAFVILVSFLVDLLYITLDPRLRVP